MKRSTLLWMLAFLITAAAAYYQRVTGPTYPVSGTMEIAGAEVRYRLDRSYGGEGDAPVRVRTEQPSITGTLQWKRFKTGDAWRGEPMTYADGALSAALPHQPPAGKLQYRIAMRHGSEERFLPGPEGIVLRFKGAVPDWILVIHVIAMFGAMLLSTRTGFEALQPDPRLRQFTFWTLGFLVVGGVILGPIVQKYAFGAYWTGWPFGGDLTDNKTLVALAGWIAAALALTRVSARRWVIGAAVLLFAVYLIPHSVLGSELDYEKMDREASQNSQGR